MKRLKKLSFDHVLSTDELKRIKGGVTACHCTCTNGVGSWIEYHTSDVDCERTTSKWCPEGEFNVVCTGIAGS